MVFSYTNSTAPSGVWRTIYYLRAVERIEKNLQRDDVAAAGNAAQMQQPAHKHRLAGTESAEPADARVYPRGAPRIWQEHPPASGSGGWGVGVTCGEVTKRTRGG